MRILAIGDNCIDEYIRQSQKYVGGCSVNFAIYIRQLGGESAYLGAVGNDENGSLIMDTIRSYGVDISHIHVMKGNTAVTKVELVHNDRAFLGYEEGVLAEFVLHQKDFEYIEHFHLVHTSVYGKIDRFLPKLKGKVKICYDFGDKLEYNNLNTVLDNIDYAFFSYKQDDDFIRCYLKNAYSHGLECAVATLGGNGSIAYDGNTFYRHGIRQVEVVDTIGAGDSFIAGFMYTMLQGAAVPECLAAGAAKAESTIQHFGAL